jgi:DNA ligase-1
MHMKTLYKRTSTGAVQEWHMEVLGDRYRTHSGQLGGAIVTSGWVIAQPTNVGRSNERTAYVQAKYEADNAYIKKLAQGGYKEDVNDIDTSEFFKPMLAKNYDDVKFDFPVYTQPKLDGIRCIATADGLWSRQGKPILAVPHIWEALKGAFEYNPDLILDGELYADKLSQDFNKIISLVRKAKPSPEELAESAAVIEYHVYDLPSSTGTFRQRSGELRALVFRHLHRPIVFVETSVARDQSELDGFNAKFIQEGYEGQMIRVGESKYENKRSKGLLKRKEFKDAEYEIVSINEGLGNRSGMAGYVTYELGDGRTFGSGLRGSHEFCKQLLIDRDKYVGGQGTVRYFALTPEGIPRFPVTTALYEGARNL